MMQTVVKPKGVYINDWLIDVERVKPQLEGLVMIKSHTGDVRIVPSAHNLEVLDNHNIKHGIKAAKKTGLPILDEAFIRQMESNNPKPYPHQMEAYTRLSAGGAGFGLFLDPGTGKTSIALNFLRYHMDRGNIDCALVVAPKGVHAQWVDDQIPIHCDGLVPFSVAWGGKGTRHAAPHDPPPRLFTINYEALLTHRGKQTIKDFLGGRRFMLVLDESHRCKNPTSLTWQRCKGYATHANCAFRLLMTGTPVSKSPLDIWAQMNLIDEAIIGHRYKTTFVNEYCVTDRWHKVVGERNTERLRQKVAPHHLRITKGSLEGMPPKVYSTRTVIMTDQQRSAYENARIDTLDVLDKLLGGQTGPTKSQLIGPSLIRLQQIANGYIIGDDGEVNLFSPSARLNALGEILASETGQAVIWCRFREDVAQVVASLQDDGEPIALPHCGTQSSRERKENVEAWLAGKAQYLVATPDTAGTGFNLQTSGCSLAIYYSTSENAVLRWQSEDRLARIGQRGEYVRYIDLVAKGTRDYAILANLKRKKGLSETTMPELHEQLSPSAD